MPTTPRPLRRLRRTLALLALVTALLIAAACRADATARALASLAAAGCLVAWLILLEVEGRAAERYEMRARLHVARRRHGRSIARPRKPSDAHRRAA